MIPAYLEDAPDDYYHFLNWSTRRMNAYTCSDEEWTAIRLEQIRRMVSPQIAEETQRRLAGIQGMPAAHLRLEYALLKAMDAADQERVAREWP